MGTKKIDTLRTFGQSDTLVQNKGGESMSNSREKQAMPTKVPFSLVGIDHVVLLVDNMRTALGFYYGVLGCQRGYSYPDLGMEQVWCGSSLIVLWDVTHPGGRKAAPSVSGGRNVDHICIATGPFDHEAMRAHLESHGVEIHQEAFHGGARGMGHSFYIHDPFGNKLEIKGPTEYPDGRATASSW